ncbi:hypothetical protein LTR16_010164, partial [Cryomyces antarcticus]
RLRHRPPHPDALPIRAPRGPPHLLHARRLQRLRPAPRHAPQPAANLRARLLSNPQHRRSRRPRHHALPPRRLPRRALLGRHNANPDRRRLVPALRRSRARHQRREQRHGHAAAGRRDHLLPRCAGAFRGHP